MARNIFIVNATQVNAQGEYSKLSGYPKTFDSASYTDEEHPYGNPAKALRRAKAAAYAQLAANYAVDDRIMQTVTIEQANGQLVFRESEGGFPPDPEPEPQPEPEEQGEE